MAAFNFPANPAQDQVFTPPGGPTYVFRAPTWLVSSPANNNYVKIAGDTMTGDLNIRKASPELRLNNTATTPNAHLQLDHLDKLRWNVGMNQDMQFEIGRFDANGAYLDTPLLIDSNNGAVVAQDALVVNRAQPVIGLNRPNASLPAQLTSQVAWTDRWIMSLGNTDPETGSGNAGSNFELSAYGDGGAYIGTPLKVGRGNMLVELGGDVIANAFLYARQGVLFSNLSSNANALDYYGEGTWVPGLTFGGNAVGLTYTARPGTWTRIGRLVLVRGQIALSAKGTSTGQSLVTGLPFANNLTTYGAFNIAYYAAFASISGMFVGHLAIPGTTFQPYVGGTTGVGPLTDANFTNTSNFTFTCVYETQ